MTSIRRIGAHAASWALLSLAACGSDVLNNTDYGAPPDGGFDPGRGGGGDGYGSGSGSNNGNFDAGPPVCPAEYKRCATVFSLPFNGETSVEIRGDYKPGGWDKGDLFVRAGSAWTLTVNFPYDKPVQYKLVLNGKDWILDPGNPNTKVDGTNTNSLKAAATCEPAICEEPGPLPPDVFDWRDSVIYFPMVDRFVDGDGQNPCRVNDGRVADLANFKGGDWAGITKKITDGYFEGLGINTLWLSVPLENAIGPDEGVNENAGKWFTGYHAYWPKDLDPKTPYHCFGTAADLKTLVQTAHAKKMKVITDYAMVHVHVTSPLYAQHKDWFWTINDGPYTTCSGNLWEVFSEANGAVFWDANREGNKCWFTPMLAHWNLSNVTARKTVVDNVVAWAKEYEFDGLRLDAVKHVDIQWLKDVRAALNREIMPGKKAGERFYLLGETYDGDPRKLKVHVDPSTMLDGQFDFALKPAVVEAMLSKSRSMADLASAVTTSETYYGANVVMSTFLGNHDQVRSIGAAGGEGNAAAYERLANAFAVLLMVKGAPSFLYGDEIGLAGGADPDNRRMMPWTGYSSAQLSMLAQLKKLTKIRADHPSLRRGQRQTLSASGDLWVFSMTTSGDKVYVAINRGDSEQTAGGLPSGALKELVTGASVNGPSAAVPPRQTRVFVAP